MGGEIIVDHLVRIHIVPGLLFELNWYTPFVHAPVIPVILQCPNTHS